MVATSRRASASKSESQPVGTAAVSGAVLPQQSPPRRERKAAPIESSSSDTDSSDESAVEQDDISRPSDWAQKLAAQLGGPGAIETLQTTAPRPSPLLELARAALKKTASPSAPDQELRSSVFDSASNVIIAIGESEEDEDRVDSAAQVASEILNQVVNILRRIGPTEFTIEPARKLLKDIRFACEKHPQLQRHIQR